MIALVDRPSISFDDFMAWYPEQSEHRYELKRGFIVEMPKPRGTHSKLAGDLAYELGTAIRKAQADFFIPRDCVIKLTDDTGYEPDVIVLEAIAVAEEPRWERESVITKPESIKLAIEIVSTNWRDDYLVKLADYEAFGIQEYWIVDYLGLGGRRYIGVPKQPTLSVCVMKAGEYEIHQFRRGDRLVSPLFPNLSLAMDQIFPGS
ncbi:MAG: Uma2 family endonuclease, partial [Synechocystis sp.]|nr:Uma2 family endonuclease [Synechocystis sp.]